jgi:hypothetical protein
VLAQETNGTLGLGRWSPTVEQIAEWTGMGRRMVLRYLKVLEQAGWLVTEKQGRRNHYTLRDGKVSPATPIEPEQVPHEAGTGVTSDTPPRPNPDQELPDQEHAPANPDHGPAPNPDLFPEGDPEWFTAGAAPAPGHGPARDPSATALEEKDGGAAAAPAGTSDVDEHRTETDAQLLHRMFTERNFGPLALRLAQRYRAARKGGYQSEAEVARVLESVLPNVTGDDGYREFIKDLQFAAGREEVPLSKGTLGVAHSKRLAAERRQQEPRRSSITPVQPVSDWSDPNTKVRL